MCKTFWLILRGVIGVAFAFANVALGQYSKQVYDEAILAGSEKMLWKLGGVYLAALIAFLVFYVLQEIVTIYIEERSAARLRASVYAGYLQKPFVEMEKIRGGDFVTRITSDVDIIKPLGGSVWIDVNGVNFLLPVLSRFLDAICGCHYHFSPFEITALKTESIASQIRCCSVVSFSSSSGVFKIS